MPQIARFTGKVPPSLQRQRAAWCAAKANGLIPRAASFKRCAVLGRVYNGYALICDISLNDVKKAREPAAYAEPDDIVRSVLRLTDRQMRAIEAAIDAKPFGFMASAHMRGGAIAMWDLLVKAGLAVRDKGPVGGYWLTDASCKLYHERTT